jgi:hypothetical protein
MRCNSFKSASFILFLFVFSCRAPNTFSTSGETIIQSIQVLLCQNQSTFTNACAFLSSSLHVSRSVTHLSTCDLLHFSLSPYLASAHTHTFSSPLHQTASIFIVPAQMATHIDHIESKDSARLMLNRYYSCLSASPLSKTAYTFESIATHTQTPSLHTFIDNSPSSCRPHTVYRPLVSNVSRQSNPAFANRSTISCAIRDKRQRQQLKAIVSNHHRHHWSSSFTLACPSLPPPPSFRSPKPKPSTPAFTTDKPSRSLKRILNQI